MCNKDQLYLQFPNLSYNNKYLINNYLTKFNNYLKMLKIIIL